MKLLNRCQKKTSYESWWAHSGTAPVHEINLASSNTIYRARFKIQRSILRESGPSCTSLFISSFVRTCETVFGKKSNKRTLVSTVLLQSNMSCENQPAISCSQFSHYRAVHAKLKDEPFSSQMNNVFNTSLKCLPARLTTGKYNACIQNCMARKKNYICTKSDEDQYLVWVGVPKSSVSCNIT